MKPKVCDGCCNAFKCFIDEWPCWCKDDLIKAEKLGTVQLYAWKPDDCLCPKCLHAKANQDDSTTRLV